MRIVFAKVAREGQNAEDKAERLMAATATISRIVLAQEACEGPNNPDQVRRLMVETGTPRCGDIEPYFNQIWFTLHACFKGVQVSTSLYPRRAISTSSRIVLAKNPRVGPNTQNRAEHLVATTGHLFEDMITTCHEGAFRQLWKKYGVELHQQCVHAVTLCSFPNYQEDESMHQETLENLGRSPSAEKHVHIVFSLKACVGPYAQDKAERLMVATCHLLEDVIAPLQQRNTSTLCWPLEACESLNTQDRPEHLTAETGHPLEDVIIAEQVAGNSSDTQSPFRQLWQKYGVKRRWHDLSSVFMTVGNADTPWHLQFFSPVTFGALSSQLAVCSSQSVQSHQCGSA